MMLAIQLKKLNTMRKLKILNKFCIYYYYDFNRFSGTIFERLKWAKLAKKWY